MNRLILFFGILMFLASCSASKFDYQTAYRFKYQQQQQEKPEQQEKQHINPPERMRNKQPELLEVSLKPVTGVKHTNSIDPAPADQQVNNSKTPTSKESFDALSKAEKRAVRQQVKQDFKTLKKEYKEAKKDAANQDIVFNQKMYIGLVIFAAGLLVAILASGPVGAVGIIVGIGLIAWGFIEQA